MEQKFSSLFGTEPDESDDQMRKASAKNDVLGESMLFDFVFNAPAASTEDDLAYRPSFEGAPSVCEFDFPDVLPNLPGLQQIYIMRYFTDRQADSL